MQPFIAEERPPFVTFGVETREDRAKSEEAGHYVGIDVDFAYITPMGSKDRIPRVVKDWFEQLEQQVREGRFNADWFQGYKKAYKMWKEGQELPVEGTPIVAWPMIGPSQARSLAEMGIRSVEDLANANDEAAQRIGMGARGLIVKAQNYLMASKDSGRVATALSNRESEVADLKERNQLLTEQNELLKAQLAALTPKQDAAPAQKSAASGDGVLTLNDLDLA